MATAEYVGPDANGVPIHANDTVLWDGLTYTVVPFYDTTGTQFELVPFNHWDGPRPNAFVEQVGSSNLEKLAKQARRTAGYIIERDEMEAGFDNEWVADPAAGYGDFGTTGEPTEARIFPSRQDATDWMRSHDLDPYEPEIHGWKIREDTELPHGGVIIEDPGAGSFARKRAALDHLEVGASYAVTFVCNCGLDHAKMQDTLTIQSVDYGAEPRATVFSAHDQDSFEIYQFNNGDQFGDYWAYGTDADPIIFGQRTASRVASEDEIAVCPECRSTDIDMEQLQCNNCEYIAKSEQAFFDDYEDPEGNVQSRRAAKQCDVCESTEGVKYNKQTDANLCSTCRNDLEKSSTRFTAALFTITVDGVTYDWDYEYDENYARMEGEDGLLVVLKDYTTGEILDILGGITVGSLQISDHGNVNISPEDEEYLKERAIELAENQGTTARKKAAPPTVQGSCRISYGFDPGWGGQSEEPGFCPNCGSQNVDITADRGPDGGVAGTGSTLHCDDCGKRDRRQNPWDWAARTAGSRTAAECSEPDGNEEVDGRTAHDVMLSETGQCPWCGEETKESSKMAAECPEPDGNEEVDGRTAHDVMIDETGQCPYCGSTGVVPNPIARRRR